MSEIPAKYTSLEHVSFPVGKITYREDGTIAWFDSRPHPPASIEVELTYEGRRYKGVLHLIEDEQESK
jgi:hypothetical protein